MRVLVFGAGVNGKKILTLPKKKSIEIIGILDNNPEKIGKDLLGVDIISPRDGLKLNSDAVIVSNEWVHEVFDIINQLIELGYDKNIIYTMCRYDLSHYMETELDTFFIIEKYEKRPFIKGKVPSTEDYGYVCETEKSYNRRKREGFFEKYCKGEGLDIGYGPFLVSPNASGWEYRNGDAQYLDGVEDESFDYVYSSHCLEHMVDVRIALKNWFRVVRKNGYMIISVPDRDLYEKRSHLPSRWNIDHKHMFLLGEKEEPDTLDILEEIQNSLKNYSIEYAKRCNEGHTIDDPEIHSDGEYQIEIVIKKTN